MPRELRRAAVALILAILIGCAGPPPPEPDQLVSYPPIATPGASGSASDSITLSGAGDIARCEADGDEATARALDRLPGWVLAVGDTVYERGSHEEFDRCYEPGWGRHRERTFPVLGNHEWGTDGAAGYFDYFGTRAGARGAGWYAFDLGTWRVIVLASTCGHVGGCEASSAQGRWLAAELANHARRCTVAAFHHPLFSSGHHGPSPEVLPFWEQLHDAGVELVVNAHEHSYERFEPLRPDGTLDAERGIRQIIVGTGGGELRGFGRAVPGSAVRDHSTYGVLRLDLREGGYDWSFVPAGDGTFTDSGSDECH